MRLVLAILFTAIFLSTSAKANVGVLKFESVFSAFEGGGAARDSARSRLLTMPSEELGRFLAEATLRLEKGSRDQVVRAFDIVRRRKDFDAARAKQLRIILSSTSAKRDVLETRLILLLDAKTGELSESRIADELKQVEKTDVPSTMRLSRLTGLTDAMESTSKAPTISQLEMLLKNDVFEIRMHAVDWFRLRPPTGVQDRARFLRAALGSNVLQVRERAYQTIASWPGDKIIEIKKQGGVLPAKCAADPSRAIQKACSEIREKVGPS